MARLRPRATQANSSERLTEPFAAKFCNLGLDITHLHDDVWFVKNPPGSVSLTLRTGATRRYDMVD